MFKLFLQDSPNDCGVACLAGILRHYGLFVTPVDLVGQVELSRAGVTNVEIQNLADRFGLENRLIRLAVDEFDSVSGPCIAYIHGDAEGLAHNVVIYRVKGDRLWVADPARGKYIMTRAKFAERYDELLLIFRPGSSFLKGKYSQSYSRRFLKFVAAYRVKILLSLAVGLLTSSVGFILIYLSKYFVDHVLPTGQINQVILFALIYFLARLLNVAATGFNHIFTVTLRNSVADVLSHKFFDHVLRLEKKNIDNRDQGDFLQQFSQIDTLTEGIANYFGNFILVVFGILVKAGFLLWLYDPVLVGIILAILALNSVLGFLFSKFTARDANRRIMILSQINTAILNSLADIRVVRIFSAHNWLYQHYRKLLAEGLGLMRRMTTLEVYGRSFADLLNLVAEAAIFLICGMRIIDGSYTIGDFLIFFAFAQGLASDSLQFPQLILSFHAQLRSFARVQAIFQLVSEVGGTRTVDEQGLEIEFKNVSFAYTKDAPVLQDVSFVIEKNRTCAFVGESGSGKTTITSLLMGFYKPGSGVILVNGKDLAELDLGQYRRRLSAVFQDTTLFHKSLYANVALGDRSISREHVAKTAKTLGVEAFIENLPRSYDHPVYPGSVSGGQTQQLAILRAMCKPFDLLVMDEATSHLDSRTEERIVNGIHALCGQNKTRAVIAHRLSTVKQADQIVVMKAGRVVEMGGHEALVARQGYYLDLIKRQYEVDLAPAPRP